MAISDDSGAQTPADALAAAAADGTDAEETLEKKALIEKVVAASGVRRRDAIKVVEATLEAIGEALDGGSKAKVSPLGQMRVIKSKAGGKALTHTLKLRRKSASTGGGAAVAEGGDAG